MTTRKYCFTATESETNLDKFMQWLVAQLDVNPHVESDQISKIHVAEGDWR